MKIGFSGELASAAAVMAAAAMLLPVMRVATSFAPGRGTEAEPFAAFVTLDAAGEDNAVRAARLSWGSSADAALERERASLSLSCDRLPSVREPEAVGDDGRTRAGRPADVGWMPPPWPSGLAAPPPDADEPHETAAPLPFPREEMLKIP